MVDSKHQWKAWLYLLPAIILLLVFTVWPIFNTVRMSFMVYWDAEEYVGWNDDGTPICDENGYPLMGKYKGYTIMKDLGGETDFEFGLQNYKEVLNYD